MLDVIEAGPGSAERIESERADLPSVATADVRLRAPLPVPPRNIMCLGLNYKEHVAEATGAPPPANPVWFTKAVTSVTGPFDDIHIDSSLSTAYDWEVELAVVIGTAGRGIAKADAMQHVYGYTVFNDFSVRDIQLQDGRQWFKGKSLDKASPMGPWLVTADELGDPSTLNVTCRVNGEVKQQSSTSLFIFDIATCIADISQVLTLQPGDIISTGTPSGVGFHRKPPERLVAGDVMETEIDRIGVLRNRIVEP
jgi:2-keto-4-pentenoate hydratase/2-oxohepta-3-ene-1,7-dioic acid hydratase in catechol pathway